MQVPTIHNVVGTETWMQCPSVQTDLPGLAFICPLDQLIVAEKRDALHDLIGNTGEAYTIFNSVGQKVFLAVLEKQFKKFNVKIFNNYGNEVINVIRPFALLQNRVFVYSPPSHYLGSVQERKSCINSYKIENDLNRLVLKIIADGWFKYVYKVYVYGGRAIGVVKKQFPLPSSLINVKNFGVSFPAELDVKDKAVLLGACFLIGVLKY